MNPAKNLLPVFYWLLRLIIMFTVYVHFWNIVKVFDTSSVSFFVAAAFVLLAIMLIVGGFARKHTLTILSGLLLAALSVYQMVQLGFQIGKPLAFYGLLATVG